MARSSLTISRRQLFLRELLGNSIHFPLINIILELLNNDLFEFILEPDLYVLIFVAVAQAYVISLWQYQEKPRPLLGNLVGPACYSIIEMSIEGLQFFSSPNHIAYWCFSLLIGSIQRLRAYHFMPGTLLIMENLVRTNILLVMYWIFEGINEEKFSTLAEFFSNSSHQFIAIIVTLLGFVIGFSQLNEQRYLKRLITASNKLKNYSEWLLGRSLLEKAIDDEQALAVSRQTRSVVFIDIRGFTQWCETRSPEEVLTLLNHYFETAEAEWKNSNVLKVKHTGDEIMLVFKAVDEALTTSFLLKQKLESVLDSYHLGIGIGIHSGELVEGLIGSREIKAYDILGDTVNTAKRLCDHAAANEMLISDKVLQSCLKTCQVGEQKTINAKGKSQPLIVYPVLSLIS